MRIKAIIYQNPFDSTIVYTQRIVTWEISITQDLHAIDEAHFAIPYIDGAEDEERGVDLYEITNNEDKKVFEGYFYQVIPQFRWPWLMDCIARSKKDFLLSRLVKTNHTYTSVSAKTVVSDLLSVYNTLGDWRVVDWSLYISSSEPLITLEVKVWDNYSDIFDEIAKQLSWQWDYRNNRIYFAKNLWIDYTDWSNKYIELYYNWTTWVPSPIKDIKCIFTADRKNVVVWIDDTWASNFQSNIVWGKIYGVTKENFRDGDLVAKTQAKLVELDRKQKIYEVELDGLKIDAGKWDKIKIRVEWHPIPVFSLNESMLILKKTISYKDWIRKDTLSIAQYAIQERTLITKLKEIRKVVDLKSI